MTTKANRKSKHNVGDIVTRKNGKKYKIGIDRKWIYIKKPREEWDIPIAKPKEKWVNNFPPVTLPDHIRPTNYPYYYISNDGIAYREPRRCDKDGRFGEVNEWGLIQLTTHLRGNPVKKDFMYESVNVYFYDENNKNVGHKKKNIHQLVAEAWVPNPHGYTEVLHGDKGNRCNHYTNLRWGTHKENMSESAQCFPEGSIIRRGKSKRKTGGDYGSFYEKKNGEWVLIPSNKPVWNKGLKGSSWNTLPDGTVRTRKVNGSPEKFIKQNGEWVYQTKKPRKPKPTNGTVTIHANGRKFIWQDGVWVYQKKKSFPDGTIRTHGNATLKKIDGKWVYQKKEKKKKIPKVTKRRLHYRNVLPEGTIRTRSDGTIWIKENGAWVYQKKKKNT